MKNKKKQTMNVLIVRWTKFGLQLVSGLVATFADFANKKAEGRIHHVIKFSTRNTIKVENVRCRCVHTDTVITLTKQYTKQNVSNLLE